MKILCKRFIGIINKSLLLFSSADFDLWNNYFYFFRISSNGANKFLFRKSSFIKSVIHVTGDGNLLDIKNANLCDSEITVTGSLNRVLISDDVNLRCARIVIRGNNCSVLIGRGSSFGGVRIVNVGSDCSINIGEGCLFSDHIELWASDTHSIYNSKKEKINPERPINIGDNVWVGSRAIILKGVSVGAGSIIGMGTIVTTDVPPQVISVGIPNRTSKEGVSWSLKYEK